MNHKAVCLLLSVSALICVRSYADDVQVQKKPAPAHGANETVVYNSWSVSAALRDDTEPTMDWGTYPTEAAAVAAAASCAG